MKSSEYQIINTVGKVLKRGKSTMKKTAKFMVNREYRALLWMQVFHRNDVQQTTQLTWEDRYPDDFFACKQYFAQAGKSQIKILSYGCCTGEEVVTLRKYFPDATIIGAEINAESLRICRKRKLDERVKFIKSTAKNIAKQGPYDAIFCMAVLQRTPHYIIDHHIADIEKIYPFSKFEKKIMELDQRLNTEGLFCVHFSPYTIAETAIATKYRPYGNVGFKDMLFDKQSKLIRWDDIRHSIYRKAE